MQPIAKPTWIIYPIAVLCVIFRAPDRLFNPQLWAEDGPIFLRESVHEGGGSLFDTYAGYLHLLLRVVALFGRWLPLEWIPAFFYFGAMTLLLFGMWLIHNSRHDLPAHAKSLMALCLPLVMFPGATMFNLTNAQWFLAPALLFLLLQKSAITGKQTALDALFILCLGLTGPFIILWLPLLMLRPLMHPFRRSDLAIFAPAIITATIQLILLLNSERIETGAKTNGMPAMMELLTVTTLLPCSHFFFGSLAPYSPLILGIIGCLITLWLAWLVVRLPRQPALMALALVGAGIAVVIAGAFSWGEENLSLMLPGGAGERYYVPLLIFGSQTLVLLAFASSALSTTPFRVVLFAVTLSTVSTFSVAPMKNFKWQERVYNAIHIPGKSRLKIHPSSDWDISVYPPSQKPSGLLLAKDFTIKRSKPRPPEESESSP
ncbi:hypothetical protein FEM03_13325 [Phragmitibacter flavus]|uniref:DUF2029 domain-containing protein n=1 Tax=Phragmitibacter flavus TaxID=2576071 RepID=A0A5R8KCY9_9BACT|nr:hypothetical protein [Phragmitibacter flavus]TLD70168.1 hypothetical protein FEM03_13325 [Phragmitibacter flavus]